MGLRYYHLDDPDVRTNMVGAWTDEWQMLASDYTRDACYGKQLTDAGWEAFAKAMPSALAEHDDEWLLGEMDQAEYWSDAWPRRNPSGTVTMVRYNKEDALKRLCYGEFNIAYIRGVAMALQARGDQMCVIYRAGDAAEPRSECSEWEGLEVPVAQVLAGHRARYFPPPGDRSVWSLPTGPNCHHSIRKTNAV